MRRRVVCVWLPYLSAERILKNVPDRDRPLAVVREERRTLRLCSLNQASRAAGLTCGMALADARAILPDLVTVPEDAERDAAFLRALGRWAQRFTPSVALEARAAADGTLMLDVSGCAHLFGGEASMLAEIEAGLARFGLTVRLGLADTRGGAWALAHYGVRRQIAPPGGIRAALEPLPVAALGIEGDRASTMSRLGLKTVRDLLRLPRASLARRFDVETVRCFDRALGTAPDPLAPMHQRAPFAARLSLPEPIGTADQVMGAVARLLDRLCESLAKEGQGARTLRLTVRRADSGRDICEIGLMRPGRDAQVMASLFERSIAKLDAGFGIDMLRLEAVQVEPLAAVQLSTDEAKGDDATDLLLASLGNRLGFDALERLAPAESHIPERSWLRLSAAYSQASTGWPDEIADRPRPVTMFAPEPLRVEDHTVPPRRFCWRRTVFEVFRATGPERITPEWWLDDPNWRTGLRDYWRMETRCARQLWVFHTPKPPPEMGTVSRWYVQGLFA